LNICCAISFAYLRNSISSFHRRESQESVDISGVTLNAMGYFQLSSFLMGDRRAAFESSLEIALESQSERSPLERVALERAEPWWEWRLHGKL
jgi:hypothetical protein